MSMRKSGTTAVAAMLSLAFGPAALAADSEPWNWAVIPYGWAASIGADLQTGTPPEGGASTDTSFGDLVDKLDGAFQLHVEGGGERFGMFADFTYLGVASDGERPRFRTDSDLDSRLFELAFAWRPGAVRGEGLELFGGLRYIDVDLTVQFTPTNPALPTTALRSDETFNDFMVGARYRFALSNRWSLNLRGDTSFGDTDGTWNASAVADYRTGNGAWFLGYRHLDVGVEAGDNDVDITMSGPIVGYGFYF
jgi:hypothetical protein